jgi:hypothetical protein
MQFVTRILRCSRAAIALSLLTACGSGSNTTVPANIRIVNDTASTLTLYLNEAAASAATPPKSSSAYGTVTPSTYTLSVASSNGSSGAATTVGLGTAQSYTALAYQRGDVVYSAVYADNQAVPTTGFSSLDVANLSQDAGPLDVYLVSPPSTDLSLLSPTFSSVQGLSTASTFAAAPTKYDVIVTGAGNPTDVRLTLQDQQFNSAQAYTLAFTSTSGGGLVNAVLVPQGVNVAAGSFLPTSQARVRVWSSLVTTPLATGIDVSVGLSPSTAFSLPTDNVSPFPIPYQLVPAGSSIQTLTVAGGGAVTIPAATFAAGGDYTIVVYGTVAAPLVSVLADSNLIISNRASVRLINAAVTGSSGVTMLINGSDAAFGVPYGSDLNVAPNGGTATAYTGISPTSTATVSLGGGNYSGGSLTQQAFNSGSVYTVFLYDPTLPPKIITDR